MKEIEKKRLAKNALKDVGIRAYIKDMTRVELHQMDFVSLDGGRFPHRQLYYVELSSGLKLEIRQETVDKKGNYSRGSALYKTVEVREV